MTSLWPDVCNAARLARRQPLFTALLVVVLSLGIGAAVAMFSVSSTRSCCASCPTAVRSS